MNARRIALKTLKSKLYLLEKQRREDAFKGKYDVTALVFSAGLTGRL